MSNVNGHMVMGNGRPMSMHSAPKNVVGKLKKPPECSSLDSRNWLIHMHYARKEFRICKIIIQEELLKSNGKCEYANYVQGILLRHEGKIQESLEYFQTSHSLNPRNVDNIKQVARSLYLLGKHRLSMEAYLEAEHASTKPTWDIFYNMGMCSVHLGDNKTAKEHLRKALQMSHQECSYTALAKIYLKENDVNGAIQIYNDALRIYPDNSGIATNLGLLYMKGGFHQEAFEKLGSALVHDPKCAKALFSIGSVMQDHKDYDVALSKYKIVSQHLPESTSLWNNIGMCFFEKKKFVAAIGCLKRANYLSPFDWRTLYNLGLVHITTQQYASAFLFLSAAINLRSNSGETFLLLAVALRHLGDSENAKQAFEQAAKLSPKLASVPLNYAGFLYSIGKSDAAIEKLEKFYMLSESITGVDQEMLDVAQALQASLSIQPKQVVGPKQEKTDSKLGGEGASEIASTTLTEPCEDGNPAALKTTIAESDQGLQDMPEMASDEV